MTRTGQSKGRSKFASGKCLMGHSLAVLAASAWLIVEGAPAPARAQPFIDLTHPLNPTVNLAPGVQVKPNILNPAMPPQVHVEDHGFIANTINGASDTAHTISGFAIDPIGTSMEALKGLGASLSKDAQNAIDDLAARVQEVIAGAKDKLMTLIIEAGIVFFTISILKRLIFGIFASLFGRRRHPPFLARTNTRHST